MIYTCTTCRRPLIEVWSGWARCECGWLTTQKPMPWDRQNRYAHGSQADPDGVKAEEFDRGPADALALMASSLLDADQQQSAVNAEPGWEAYSDLSPLEARYADGDR
jgi:hypothetical protein